MVIKINALDHLFVNVTDAEKPAAWYEQALDMTRHGARGRLNPVCCRYPDGSLIEIASYKK